MERALGLDIGSNSIGWSIIELAEDNSRIIDLGVRIFPEGVENLGDGEKEVSLNASRREARQRRRQLFRRKLRKEQLLKVLREHQMCPPITDEELRVFRRTGTLPPSFDSWFALNPYTLRSKALTHPLTLHELGRIFYHLAQRRGYLTNSRKGDSEEGKIYQGDPKEDKHGIESTRTLITPTTPTLGAALAQLLPPPCTPYQGHQERIRNRYTERSMYIEEFDKIWHVQQQYHRSVLTDQLKVRIGGRKRDGYPIDGILFFQRPLRSQKALVGRCTLEPSKPRMQRSHPLYEEFRAYQFVNTIECNGEPLTDKQRQTAVAYLLSQSKARKFKDLRKHLKLADRSYSFNYDDDSICPCSPTTALLCSKDCFGQRWFTLSEKEQNDIWHALVFFTDIDKLERYAQEKLNLSPEAARKVARFKPEDGYASLSMKAVRRILPYLRKGYLYHQAVALAGVEKAFGQRWSSLTSTQRDALERDVIAIVQSNISGGYITSLRQYLSDNYDCTEKELAKLYHHSMQTQHQRLPKLPAGSAQDDRWFMLLRNPVVSRALFELRRIINHLLDRYGPFDRIVIELARDLKATRQQRFRIRQEQERNRRIREAIATILENKGYTPTSINILKYRLWLECNKTCPYSGRTISLHELMSGEVQIEHILPYSRTLDDSYLNKTLCFADINREKGDQTPYEYFSQLGPQRWEEFKLRIKSIFVPSAKWDKNDPLSYFPQRYAKYKRFIQEKLTDDFISRQLNDTRIISVRAREYLQLICEKVDVVAGPITARLRHLWGVENLLHELPEQFRLPSENYDLGADEKQRTDHRHHAVDATVVACVTPKILQALSKCNRYNRSIPEPWARFRTDLLDAVKSVAVSYNNRHRVLTLCLVKTTRGKHTYSNLSIAARGQLHMETFYGYRFLPHMSAGFYLVRKSLSDLTKKSQIEKIADPVLRALIEERINELGGYEGDKVPNGAFFGKSPDGRRQPLIFLPNRHGAPVPVFKVRIAETMNNAAKVRSTYNCYVNPRNNHHALVYYTHTSELAVQVVQFWNAVQRCRRGEPLYQLPPDGAQIFMRLHKNDMVLLGMPEDEYDELYTCANSPNSLSQRELRLRIVPYLYKVQKLSGTPETFELAFRRHIDARLAKYAQNDYVLIKGFGDGKLGLVPYNPRKVLLRADGYVELLEKSKW